jgi:hypothetical protein
MNGSGSDAGNAYTKDSFTAAASGGSSSSGYSVPQWTGKPDPSLPDHLRPSNSLGAIPADDWRMKIYEIEATQPETYEVLTDMLKDSGYTSWESLGRGAALAGMDWQDFLVGRADMKLGRGGGGGGPTTTVSYDLSSESESYRTANPYFSQGLGRNMSAKENREFQKVLNQFQKENPTITTSGRGYSNSKGGFDPTQLAMGYVKGQENYAETQVATSFMSVLDSVLKNPQSLGQTLQERMN